MCCVFGPTTGGWLWVDNPPLRVGSPNPQVRRGPSCRAASRHSFLSKLLAKVSSPQLHGRDPLLRDDKNGLVFNSVRVRSLGTSGGCLPPGWPSEVPALAVLFFPHVVSPRGSVRAFRGVSSSCSPRQPCATWSLLPLLEPSSVCQHDGQPGITACLAVQ